jgi:hypothetical protein
MDKLSEAFRARISNLAKDEAARAISFRAEVLARARAGDWYPLALYLRGRGAVTREVWSLVSEILLGKRRRPKGKIKKFATEHLKIDVATFVIEARFLEGEKNATKLAAKKFKKSERTILRYLAESKRWMDEIASRITESLPERESIGLELFHMFNKRVAKHRRVSTVPRYFGASMTPAHYATSGDI